MHVCSCVGDVEIVLMRFLSLLSLKVAPLVTYPVSKKNVCDWLSWTLSVFYSESGTFRDAQPSRSRQKLIFKRLAHTSSECKLRLLITMPCKSYHCMKYSHLTQVKVLIV